MRKKWKKSIPWKGGQVSGATSGDSFSVLIQKNEQERIQKSERLDSLLAGERKAQQDIANIHQWAGTIR